MPKKNTSNITIDYIADNMPDLPEDFERWLLDNPLRNYRYMFTYRKKGVRYGYCTNCGQIVLLSACAARTWTQKEEENSCKKHNENGYCPNCESRVFFKDSGRGRSRLIDCGYAYILQAMPDGGLLIRTFACRLDYRGDFKNVRPQTSEHYRLYFNDNVAVAYKRKLNDFYFLWNSPDVFYDVGYEGYMMWRKMTIIPRPDFPKGYFCGKLCQIHYMGFSQKTVNNTFFKYCCIDAFMQTEKPDVCRYLSLYAKNPLLYERLIKEGFMPVVLAKVDKEFGWAAINWRAKTVPDALKMNKASVRNCAGMTVLGVAVQQIACLYNVTDEDDLEFLRDSLKYCDYSLFAGMKRVLKFTTVRKLRKYIQKNKNNAKKKKTQFYLSDYFDYISQCLELKLDLTKKNMLYPQDFNKAHEENSALLTEIKLKTELEAARIADADFAVKCKKLDKKYGYIRDGLSIRPAAGKAELIIEGKTLNHCVAQYAERYLRGDITLLFIRQVKFPDVPFYTLELSKEGRIIQCRGKGNRGMTDDVKAFVAAWEQDIKERKNNKNNKKAVGTPAA